MNRKIEYRGSKWPPTWKLGLSLLIILHLLAVSAEPFRFFTASSRGTSPAADIMRWALAPYVEFAYFNHAYFFFAPEPLASHLMECRLQLPSGKQGRLLFPDKQAQRPRLLYHRHFMYAEFLHQLHVPPVEPQLALENPRLAEALRLDRRRYEVVRSSMEAHLAARYQAQAVRIDRVEHRLPSSDEVLYQRLPLDAPQLYVILPDGYSDSSVDLPAPEAGGAPSSSPGEPRAVPEEISSSGRSEDSQS